ncbi:hypothetical protein H6G41_00045 [Tolypothrix sp. FACHB-123]|uniref:hypothetical protein n=1 Tax=Tolypothrix sp. FACHB-123 TaxID=2692868 RepID=UPI0016869B48|nr:hypothetical protein [Tolypothrix sp. FACHB-123]MBD2353024.1 hypothetical protein [Tolypothrix sp. FACHB-123]
MIEIHLAILQETIKAIAIIRRRFFGQLLALILRIDNKFEEVVRIVKKSDRMNVGKCDRFFCNFH